MPSCGAPSRRNTGAGDTNTRTGTDEQSSTNASSIGCRRTSVGLGCVHGRSRSRLRRSEGKTLRPGSGGWPTVPAGAAAWPLPRDLGAELALPRPPGEARELTCAQISRFPTALLSRDGNRLLEAESRFHLLTG